jgi:hypothetical protein
MLLHQTGAERGQIVDLEFALLGGGLRLGLIGEFEVVEKM